MFFLLFFSSFLCFSRQIWSANASVRSVEIWRKRDHANIHIILLFITVWNKPSTRKKRKNEEKLSGRFFRHLSLVPTSKAKTRRERDENESVSFFFSSLKKHLHFFCFLSSLCCFVYLSIFLLVCCCCLLSSGSEIKNFPAVEKEEKRRRKKRFSPSFLQEKENETLFSKVMT